MKRKDSSTYNTQTVEIRSHSFALYFPPEGDFASEAHRQLNQSHWLQSNLKKKKRVEVTGLPQETHCGLVLFQKQNYRSACASQHTWVERKLMCEFASAHVDTEEVDM